MKSATIDAHGQYLSFDIIEEAFSKARSLGWTPAVAEMHPAQKHALFRLVSAVSSYQIGAEQAEDPLAFIMDALTKLRGAEIKLDLEMLPTVVALREAPGGGFALIVRLAVPNAYEGVVARTEVAA